MKTKTILAILITLGGALNASAEEAMPVKRTQISVNVMGAVNQPSRLTLSNGATILDALAAAGSAIPTGNLSKVKVIHKTTGEKPDTAEVNVKKILNGSASNVVLRDGDTISVPKVFYVMQ